MHYPTQELNDGEIYCGCYSHDGKTLTHFALLPGDCAERPEGCGMSDNLKSCPFCGGKPEKLRKTLDERFGYAHEVTYRCTSCGCSLMARGDTNNPGYADNSTVEQRALAAWNARASCAEQLSERVTILEAERDELLVEMGKAANEIRRCDYVPARSTLLTAIARVKGN